MMIHNNTFLKKILCFLVHVRIRLTICHTVLSSVILPLSQSMSKLFNFNFLFLLLMTDILRDFNTVEKWQGQKGIEAINWNKSIDIIPNSKGFLMQHYQYPSEELLSYL